jgi:hypothetical protein
VKELLSEQVISAPQTHNVLDKEFIATLEDSIAPSVLNLVKFQASGSVQNISNFSKGQIGQTITILGDGNRTVEHDVTKVVTNTGADKLLENGKVYRFTKYPDNVWYEDNAGGGPGALPTTASSVAWADITGKPATFPPTVPIHWANIDATPTTLGGYAIGDAYTKVASDARFAAIVHTHAAADITSGTFADARIAQSNVTQHQAALSIAFTQLTGLPSTLAGHGITDAYTKVASDARFAPIVHTHPASDVTTGTFGAGDFRFQNNVVVGQAIAAVSPLTVTNYAYTLPANIIVGELAHFAGAEGVVPSVMIDAFQNAPLLAYRRAQSAAGVLSGVLINQALAIIQSYGYGTTGYVTNSAPRIIASAEENWTDTAAGARLSFSTRPSGSIAAATEVLRLGASGDVGIVATKKLFIDGVALAGNTYLTESSADVFDIFAGGTNSLRITPTGISIPDGNTLYFGGSATAPSITHSSSGLDFRLHASVGSNHRFLGTGGGLLTQFTNAGIWLTGGTTIVAGAANGDIVTVNNKGIRGVDAATGATTYGMIAVNASDRIVVDINGRGLQYGLALITLGTTTLITLGKTGGSGPATAAQNSWMKMWDSAGNAFFIPVWK